MTLATQYCSFHVGDLFFGIDVRVVQELIRYQEMTRVPLAPPEVCGLINLRGQIVTAIDLRRRLGLADRTGDVLPMNVVVRTDGGVVSLLADEIGDVVTVDAAQFEPRPDTVVGRPRDLISGVFKMQDRLLLVLDTEKAVDVPAAA